MQGTPLDVPQLSGYITKGYNSYVRSQQGVQWILTLYCLRVFLKAI